ncbi:MAG: hypothetical protein JWO78_1636 [Micavibrio sp.]|nr:hypothetical protein [Micavibrio sp.]
MTRTRIFAVALSFALMLAASPVYAADETAAAPVKEGAGKAAPEKVTDNPYRLKVDKRSKEIGAKLQPKELEHLAYIREGFGILRAVYMVERDVGTAVKACGRDNPALREGMDRRFSSWTGAVDPVMKEKQDRIDAAVNDQTYIKPKEIKDYLKLIEQAAEHANRTIDKEIITTPEACNSLAASMDRTQDTVAKLLGQVQVKPWPPVDDGSDEDKPVTTPN